MEWIRSPRTALCHILAVYITCMCPCDLDLWPIFTKIGSHDRKVTLNICGYFEINSYLWKMQISWHYCYATVIEMATSLCPTIFGGGGGVVRMSAPTMQLIGPPTTELLQFLLFAWPCELDLWLLYLGVISPDGTWVVIKCATFEMYTTYVPQLWRLQFSIDCQSQLKPQFLRFCGVKGVKFHI